MEDHVRLMVPVIVLRGEVEDAFNSNGLELPDNWKEWVEDQADALADLYGDGIGVVLGSYVDYDIMCGELKP